MDRKPEEQIIEKIILSFKDESEECEQEELYYKLWEDDRI